MQSTLNTFHTAGTGSSSVATGGLGYFDSLISIQTPKITITTVYLSDPSKEFMVISAVAPPVKLLDLVTRVETNPMNVNMHMKSYHSQDTRAILFEIPEKMYFKKYTRPIQVYNALADVLGESRVELLESGSFILYIPSMYESRVLIDEILEIVVKKSNLTPRGKEKSSRGVVGARRVKGEKWIQKNGELFFESFTQIEVYGNFRLADLFCIEGIDCKRTTCNDISEIQATFGVCAAKQFLTKELYRTVTGSGSNVNPRYVMQASDFMAYTGKVSPVTRHGMDLFSPLKSAAFEQPGKVLVNAALSCKTEHMLSPTSNVVFGQEIRGIGTAIVDTIPIETNGMEKTLASTSTTHFEPDLIIPFMKFTESFMCDHDHDNGGDNKDNDNNVMSFDKFSDNYLQISSSDGNLMISDEITGEEFVMQLDF
jgi:DNA-directed RNA polymerase subunit A"